MSKKNENRQFVSASGTANDLVQKLAQAVYKRGGDDDDLRRIISDTDLCGKMAELLVAPKSEQSNPVYVVTVDLTKTLAEMIAVGKYDYANPDIKEKHFPTPRMEAGSDGPYRTAPTEISLEIVHLNKLMTTKEIEAELDRRGLRPATLAELLALGAKYPELQRQFPLVALGSSWVGPDGLRSVPYLGRRGGERDLCLLWGVPSLRWDEDCPFVAVRK